MILLKPTEKYSDDLSLNIRVLQIIEKYNLRTMIDQANKFILQGDTSSYSVVTDTQKNLIMAIKLPMTPADLKTGSNFEGSALEEFLNIESIFNDPITEVINIEKRGESFKAERFHTKENLGATTFDLIANESFDLLSYNYKNRRLYFAFDTKDESDQIVLYIKYNLQLMLMSNSQMEYICVSSDGKELKKFNLKVNTNDANLGNLANQIHFSNNKLSILTMVMYAMQTLYEISKYHDLGLTGSFRDLVGYDAMGANITLDDMMYVNGTTFKTKQDLSKKVLDIVLLEPNNKVLEQNTIPARANGINPLDRLTYSKFLFNKDKMDSFSAFNIIPESEKAPDILEIKNRIPDNNRFQTIKTALIISDDTSIPKALETYREYIKTDTEKLYVKWNNIVQRILKYDPEGLGEVSKIGLALLFIKKYMWSSYKYNHQVQADESNIPYMFSFLQKTQKIKPALFFGIDGYESYFNDLVKVNAVVTQLDRHNRRYTDHGNLKNTSDYFGIVSQFYFPNPGVLTSEPKTFKHSYTSKINIIINDSYTKQAWKPKIKFFIDQGNLSNATNQAYILTTKNKLETMLLKKVLRDRPDVYQFSNFEKGTIKKKTTVVDRKIKSMVIDQYNYYKVNKRIHWYVDTHIKDGTTGNYLYIPYSVKKGFMFGGNYINISTQQSRFQEWERILRVRFKKKLVFIYERDIVKLGKDNIELNMFEDFLQEDEFKGAMLSLANETLIVDNEEQRKILVTYLKIIQDYFLDEVYQQVHGNKTFLAERVFHQFVKLIGDRELKSTLTKMIPYFPINCNRSTYYNKNRFSTFITTPPLSGSFDIKIFNDVMSLRKTLFTEEEIKRVDEFNLRHQRANRNKYYDQSLKAFNDSLTSLLERSNYINLNIEEQEKIVEARVKIYLLDFLALIQIT